MKKVILILISIFIIICALLVACKSTKVDSAYSDSYSNSSVSEQLEEKDVEKNDISDYPTEDNSSNNKKENNKNSERVTYSTTKPIPTKEKDFIIYENGTTTIIHTTVYDTTTTTTIQKEDETTTENPNDLPIDWNWQKNKYPPAIAGGYLFCICIWFNTFLGSNMLLPYWILPFEEE